MKQTSAREASRLARLFGYRILDTPPESAFDDLARRAQEAARAPMAWIAFHDGEREWVKAGAGIGFAELSGASRMVFRDEAGAAGVLEVEDARLTDLRTHALVLGDPRVSFLCSVPLVTADGYVMGALAVADRVPRRLGDAERTALENLAALAMARLEARCAPASATDADNGLTGSREAPDQSGRERDFSDAVIQSLPNAFFVASRGEEMLRWNARLQAALGYANQEIAAMRPPEFFAPADRAAVQAALRGVMDDGGEKEFEARLMDKGGALRPYAFVAKPLRLSGEPCVMGFGRDISARKRVEEQTRRAKERLDLALAGSSLALWDWDLRSNRLFFHERWSEIVGTRAREITVSWEEVRGWNHPQDADLFEAAVTNAVAGVSEAFECEYRVRHAGGEWVWIHSRGKVTQRDETGRATRMTGTSTDVSRRKEAEERAEYLATRDPLTGLPNRLLLHDRLEQSVMNASRHRSGFAFMFIDLDRFKTINDSLGHDVGDALLKQVAGLLTSCVRASDTVARLGGDEFAVIIDKLRDADDEAAQQVAEKMISAMAAPIQVGTQQLNTSCSIGIALYPSDGKDSATLMKHADVAMYYAKEKGRNNFQYFAVEMNARAQERLNTENYLRLALRRNELVLHYQPRLRMSDGALSGMEALVRWSHPRKGLLAPDRFIDVAEDSGLIVPIGEWVLERACRQVREWQRSPGPGLRVSVNVSPAQVGDGERLIQAVERAVRGAGIEPSTLQLEFTEDVLMRDLSGSGALLGRLGDFGVGISIDDFGTGYSSLARLKELPVDAIKIDGTFVRDIGLGENAEAIPRAIIAMAHSFGLSVVAEGVETAAQLATLKSMGCDEYQGFYANPALPPAEFERRYHR